MTPFKFRVLKLIVSCLFVFFTTANLNTITAQVQLQNGSENVEQSKPQQIIGAKKINATTVEVSFSNNQKMLLDFYGDNIFRFFQDNSGKGVRAPEAKPDAQILVDNPRKEVSSLNIDDQQNELAISTGKIKILFNKQSSLFKIINRQTNAIVVEQTALALFVEKEVSLTLKESGDEYFYGGGVQNGRFSHKGTTISIENQNSWTDGGVASPNPF